MATYNGSRYIREQLASLVAQTYTPFELVVRDDGSQDNTLDLIRDFADVAPFPVKILPTCARLGFENNFLRVAEACSGTHIAWCDQDDIWLPEKLHQCAARLREDDSIMALHTMTLIDAEGHAFGHWGQDITSDALFVPLELDPYHTGWGNSMVFARELVHLVPNDKRPHQPEYPHRTMSHDTWIYTLAAALGRVSHIQAPLVLYRQHANNAAGAGRWRKQSRLRTVLNLPLYRWREQSDMYFYMSRLFDSINQERASRAAKCFKERGHLLALRLQMFESSTVSMRMGAYRKYNQVTHPSAGSQLKALFLGVLAGRKLLRNG